MKLVMDGVFFQLTNTGIARVWSSILPRLAKLSRRRNNAAGSWQLSLN